MQPCLFVQVERSPTQGSVLVTSGVAVVVASGEVVVATATTEGAWATATVEEEEEVPSYHSFISFL